MHSQAPTDFTRVRRRPQRGAYDAATIHAILDAAPMCHVGHVVAGRPVVIPTLHWRDGDRVYFHGSAASRMLETAPAAETCLTASLFDGWVLARSAFNHSANYRSVMVFGRPEAVTDIDAKRDALTRFTERLFPGRWAALRPVTAQELKATTVLFLPLGEASAKLRAGPPGDDPEDLSWPVWAGVLPARLAVGAAEPAEDLAQGLMPPDPPGFAR